MSELKAGIYQAYPEYKDSGVEWLDVIPKHWVMSKIKYIAPFQVGWTPPTKNDENFVGENLWVNISDLKEKIIATTSKRISDKAAKEASMSITPKGSLMYSFKLSVGTVSFAGEDMYTNEAIASFLDSARLPLSYLYYALPKFLIENASTNIYGARILNQELINNAQLLEPTFYEAENIANFLDRETAKIDTLIEKQQQLIKLLKEKRQAVISHAVTKGIPNKEHPQAPMKDSDVAWLGEVPEHWGMIKLKHITHQIIDAEHKTAPYYDDGEYLVCRTTNVKDGKLRLEGGKYTNNSTYEEWTKRGLPEVGDILFTREAPAGEACVYTGEVPLCLGQRMVLFKLDQTRVSPDFVLHSIYSGLADDFVKQLSQGSTVAHFNMADIKNIPLFEPPIDEQVKIVEYLSMVLAKYDSLTSSVFRAIELMQERRTALISAAVTGKIDVRHWEQPND
tara:strand:- start:9439 stop:10791 length:1353 start_codon:yes stop_codon:yes gene_type:complete